MEHEDLKKTLVVGAAVIACIIVFIVFFPSPGLEQEPVTCRGQ
jgi:hypothetical protein